MLIFVCSSHRNNPRKLDHYPSNTPIAVCFPIGCGWTDEKIGLVPLEKMAQVTREEKLIRTTLCLISPALNPSVSSRYRLYHPQHSHLFSPQI